MPIRIVNQHIAERQHTHGNGALLVMADSDEIARIGQHAHYFTLGNTFVYRLYGTRENPRMEPAQALVLTLAESYLFVHLLG